MKPTFFKLTLFVVLLGLGACSQPSNPEPEVALEPTIQMPGGRPEVPLSRLPKKRVMVALAFGQSNSANSGDVRGHGGENVYNFFQGRLYEAQDPLLGATRDGGSVWTRLGRKLIAGNEYDAVVFVTVGVGGSEVARWTPGGDLHPRVLRAVRDLRGQGLTVTHLLWHQGETDNARKTSKEAYKKRFLSMLGSIRRQGVNAPIYVSTATRYKQKGPNRQLRQAQLELVNPARNIFAGPDTDKLGEEYRYDGTHFNSRGLEVFADLWLQKLGVKVGDLPTTRPDNTGRYVINFQGLPTDTSIRGVRVGSGVDHKSGKNPKKNTISVFAQPRVGGRMARGRPAKIVNVYGSKRLSVAHPQTNEPSPQGGRIRLGFAAFDRGGVKITSLTLSNVTTGGGYMQFFYAGGGASRRYQLVPTGADKSVVLPADIERVRAVDIVVNNAFAVDDVAFSD